MSNNTEIRIVTKASFIKSFPNVDANQFTDYDNIAIRYIDGKADAYSKDVIIDDMPFKLHNPTA